MSHPQRLERLRSALEAQDLDALLLSQPESRYYLSGYSGHDLPPRDSAGYLLITSDRAVLLTDPRTTEQAEQESPDFEVVTYAAGNLGPQTVAETAARLGAKRLAFETHHLPYFNFHQIRSALPAEVELVPDTSRVDDLRVIKDAEELAQLQEAIDVLDRCLADVLRRLDSGMTERQVARMVELYLIEHADGPSFPSIVASGPNASVPHAVPSDRRINVGEGIKIDIGARAHGYVSDMTRTVCLGAPKDPRISEIYGIVLEAQERSERMVRPGMTGREADALARDVITRAGYGEAFLHSLGHGIGLEVHERPAVSHTRGDEPLEPGMVFSVEPGIYLPGWGGVRIEDLVLLEDSGAKVLCHSPKDLVIEGARTPVPSGGMRSR